jgi:hypothetical protein
MYWLMLIDTNEFLLFPFVEEAIIVKIRDDMSRSRGMTLKIFFLASPCIVVNCDNLTQKVSQDDLIYTRCESIDC